MNPKQRFQVESTLNKRDKADRGKVKEFLGQLWYPLCYLDFETFRPPIPRFDGSWPYEQVPFQFSACVQAREGARLTHHEFLAEPGDDPRPAFLESLLRTVPKGACIVAYNAAFERGRLKELADLYPKHRTRLTGMIESFVDLMQPFKKRHVYLWKMKGGYSLKDVLPAMVPGMTYEGMEVADGGMAEQAFLAMSASSDATERGRLRKALLAYCKQDTLGMAEIVKRMRSMAS